MSNYPEAVCGTSLDSRRTQTVGENIDEKIKRLRKEIDDLEASKSTMSPLLNMRICDIQSALSY